MDCPACGSASPPDANFCSQCGLRLVVDCTLCRTRNEATNLYCVSCGQPLLAPSLDFQASDYASPEPYSSKHLGAAGSSGVALDSERRRATVLFCDIVDSTRRAAEIGPEAMHLLLNEFFRLGLTEVNRFEGAINNFLGDGFMALFGAPRAHEDHARQAVLAAMAIQTRMTAEKYGREHRIGSLTVRIGINTGPVVVGRIGDNLRTNYTADGETTNLAFRLQQHAEPGTILIGEATNRLVRGYVNVEPLPVLQLRHTDCPIAIYKVTGRGGRRSRIDAVAHPPETTFVGRGAELSALVEALAQATRRNGRVVGVTADARRWEIQIAVRIQAPNIVGADKLL
jgi:class 3 adenylate cyclase